MTGTAYFTLAADMLTVRVVASGLEAGMVHPQHIHGKSSMGVAVESTVPPPSADTDGDGFVELAEGVPFYGPVLLSLTSPPGGVLSDFPTAPGGTINFTQQYDISGLGTLLPLDRRVYVLHGLTVGTQGAGTPGEVNGEAGYKAVLPIAAGEIQPVPEPSTFALFGLGIAATVLVRRRVVR